MSTDLPFTKVHMGLRLLPTSAFVCVLPWEPGEKGNGFSAVVEQCTRSPMVVAPGLGGHVEGELMLEQRRGYASRWLCCPRQTGCVYYNDVFWVARQHPSVMAVMLRT